MTPDRLLVSRAGFVADPAMAHAEKAYDSDWAYAGQLIAAGWQDDPAASAGPTTTNKGATYSNAPWVIDFPECPFIPTVSLSIYASPTYELGTNEPRGDGQLTPLYWEWIQVGSASPYNNQQRFWFEVTTNSIIITRRDSGQGWRYRFRFALYYQIYGFAGP